MKIYIDGGVRSHQFRARRSGYIAIALGGEKLIEEAGEVTSNQAEYLALIKALEIALQRKISRVEILSDSELLVKQMKGEYRVKSGNLTALYKKAAELISAFNSFEIKWIPREQNIAGKLLENNF